MHLHNMEQAYKKQKYLIIPGKFLVVGFFVVGFFFYILIYWCLTWLSHSVSRLKEILLWVISLNTTVSKASGMLLRWGQLCITSAAGKLFIIVQANDFDWSVSALPWDYKLPKLPCFAFYYSHICKNSLVCSCRYPCPTKVRNHSGILLP